MRIGTGIKNDQGGLRFEVRIPFLAPCVIDLEKVENPGERAPHWHVLHKGERCGALWRRVPKNGGEAFLSGVIESPVFPGGELKVAVFNSKTPGVLKDMTWRPWEEEAPSSAPPRSRPVDDAPTAQASPPRAEDDDDIPF